MQGNEPLSMPRRFITKESNIYGFVIKIENDINTFYDIISILKNYNINITGIVGNLIENDISKTSFFLILDFIKSNINYKDFLELIKKQKGVIFANILERPSKDIIVDTYHYPLIVSKKRRTYMFSEDLVTSMIKGIIDRFGKEIGQTVLFYIGKEFGKGIVEMFDEYNLGEETPLAIFYSGQANGLWKGTINLDKNKSRFYLKFEDNFECRANRSSEIKSSLVRGMWETIMSKFYGEEIKMDETKCIAAGDEFCELKII